ALGSGAPAAEPPMGAIQGPRSTPFGGFDGGDALVPGLPSVALGYDWLARVRGLQGPEMWAKMRATPWEPAENHGQP
ncbi:MAG TPA: hypothetical protein VNE39_25440, partial [Planctomycetota bacterium]|nr:hypothetical protein [Planctomycetota bacterium]